MCVSGGGGGGGGGKGDWDNTGNAKLLQAVGGHGITHPVATHMTCAIGIFWQIFLSVAIL